MGKKVTVIGMGYWGKNLVRNFHAIGALHAVCDSNKDVQATVNELYPGVRFLADIDTVLNDADIDAVAIATPAVTHHDLAKRAMLAGKDVFVEKPLSVDVADGEDLVSIASSKNRILMVGHILRYHPAVLKLTEMVHGGELGDLQYFYSNRLNMGKIRTEENILWSFAPHDISVMLSLLQEQPSDLTCQATASLSSEVADSTMSSFRFPSGVNGHIYVSWLHPFKEQRLVVIGSEGMAVFDDTAEDKLVVYPHKVEWHDQVPTAVKADKQVVQFDAYEPLRRECEAFIDSIETRTPPVTDGKEGLAVLKILAACQLEMEKN